MRPEIVALAQALGRTVTDCIAEHLGEHDGRLTEAELDRLEVRLEAELERVAIVEEASRCVLIDGDNLFRRAYFAVPHNAVRAFHRTLANTLEALAPDLALVVFDAGGDGGRRALLPTYKCRPAPPDELTQQYAPARRAVAALGLRWIEDPRWEADDLLASYTRATRRAGYSTVIVTSDKDLLQLCDDPLVELYDTKTRAFHGAAHCEERFGVPPRLLGDLLGLAGDTSDNVPGIPGVGLKTGAALLLEHGSLEGVLAAAPSMQGKRRERLLEHAETARTCRRVVALHEDVPLAVPLTELVAPGARHKPRRRSDGPGHEVRKILFLPDGPAEAWYVAVAALQRHPDGRVTVHEGPRPTPRAVGGASKLALLDLQLAYVRGTEAFDRLHPTLGDHFALGAVSTTRQEPAVWAALPVVVDDRQARLPRPGRSIAPGSPLGAHGYRSAKHGPATRPLVRRWLFAQIQAGGRALEELRSIGPGEHLGTQGEPYGPEVVKAWAYVQQHKL